MGDSSLESQVELTDGTMSSTLRYVLVACGSFNPVHNLHLRMLELTKDELKRQYRIKHNLVPLTKNLQIKECNPQKSSLASTGPSRSKSSNRVQFSDQSSNSKKRNEESTSSNGSGTASPRYRPFIRRTRSIERGKNLALNSSDAEASASASSDRDIGSSSRHSVISEKEVPTELSDSQFIGLLSPVSDGYKKKGLQPFEVRSKLVELACQSSKWIKLSSWEGKRNEWTPTKDVLLKIKGDWTIKNSKLNPIETEVVFVCGADVFTSFAKPGLWKDEDLIVMFTSCYLGVINRGDFDIKSVLDSHKVFQENPELKEKIIVVEDKLDDELSSTFVRDQLMNGCSVRYLVPDAVADYLEQNEIYTEESMQVNLDVELAPMVKNRE